MKTNEELARDARTVQDEAVLKQYGLRWAVLAGWHDALHLRHVTLAAGVDSLLETVRVKLATGCFSVCEVGCDMSQLEGALTAADASTDHNWVDFWVDLLANSMKEKPETERILKIPAIKARYNNCGLTACRC